MRVLVGIFLGFLCGLYACRGDELADCIPAKELAAYSFPISKAHRQVWVDFYCGSSEAGNISYLAKAGPAIASEVQAAIKDKKLYKRRYAITALGYIGGQDSLPILKSILDDTTEEDYFRSDALNAIYVIDQSRGSREAAAILKDLPPRSTTPPILIQSAQEIVQHPETISLKWKQNYGPSGVEVP